MQRNLAPPPAKQEWDEIDKALARVEQSDALAVAAAVLRADVLLARGKPDAALQALGQARDRRPERSSCGRRWRT